ncbi:MAG: recombination protein NinB [Lautropia sp.]
MKAYFVLSHPEARRRAMATVAEAPEGHSVAIAEPTRTIEQNSLLWTLLTAFSEQLQWPVNGRMGYLSPEDWKAILSAGFYRETRVAEGLDGGHVMLGQSTSRMGKREFSDFVEYIHSIAAARGVEIHAHA